MNDNKLNGIDGCRTQGGQEEGRKGIRIHGTVVIGVGILLVCINLAFSPVFFWAAAAILLLAFLGLGSLTIGFCQNKKQADLEWEKDVPEKMDDFGSVRKLTILPLIDWYAGNDSLIGEPGVSWLVRADENNILMDTGLNSRREEESPLLRNMKALNVNLVEIRHLFISHLHMDHVGGIAAQKARTVKLSSKDIDLSRMTLYAPTEMVHASAEVRLIDKPEALMPGVASEGPISRSIFAMGMTREQALAVNVAGKGLVLIVGCGHQGIRRIFERAEAVFSAPVYGIVAGLHYPVTGSRLKMLGLPMQKFIGTGKLPWQNITRKEVHESIEYLKSKNLKFISVSAHDSCDWTLNEFKMAFQDIYHELKAGKPLEVNA